MDVVEFSFVVRYLGAWRKTRPTSRRHQEERTELTRRRLLKAAEAVFIRDGFQAAKIEDIAKAAGYTRGAFYANFQSKEDLFITVAERELKGLTDKLRTAVLSESAVDKKAKAVLQTVQESAAARRWALLLLEFDLFFLRQPSSEKTSSPYADEAAQRNQGRLQRPLRHGKSQATCLSYGGRLGVWCDLSGSDFAEDP